MQRLPVLLIAVMNFQDSSCCFKGIDDLVVRVSAVRTRHKNLEIKGLFYVWLEVQSKLVSSCRRFVVRFCENKYYFPFTDFTRMSGKYLHFISKVQVIFFTVTLER